MSLWGKKLKHTAYFRIMLVSQANTDGCSPGYSTDQVELKCSVTFPNQKGQNHMAGPFRKKESIFFISKWTNSRFSLELYLILHWKSMEKAYFVHQHYFPMFLYSLLTKISLGSKEVLRSPWCFKTSKEKVGRGKKLEAIYPTTYNIVLTYRSKQWISEQNISTCYATGTSY